MESDPESLNIVARKLGMSEEWSFFDIYGLDEDMLSMIPQPCLSVVLLFPSAKKTENKGDPEDSVPFYLTQISDLGNACGTIAVIHTLANNLENLGIKEGAVYDYVNKNKSGSALERGESLNSAGEINEIHNEGAESGQTESTDGHVDFHFICFTAVNGNLYELDGGKKGPINHGPLGDRLLSHVAAEVIQTQYITPNPDVFSFSMLGLGPA